jgi:hypothetical protein
MGEQCGSTERTAGGACSSQNVKDGALGLEVGRVSDKHAGWFSLEGVARPPSPSSLCDAMREQRCSTEGRRKERAVAKRAPGRGAGPA